jgi:hypothetical protein
LQIVERAGTARARPTAVKSRSLLMRRGYDDDASVRSGTFPP